MHFCAPARFGGTNFTTPELQNSWITKLKHREWCAQDKYWLLPWVIVLAGRSFSVAFRASDSTGVMLIGFVTKMIMIYNSAWVYGHSFVRPSPECYDKTQTVNSTLPVSVMESRIGAPCRSRRSQQSDPNTWKIRPQWPPDSSSLSLPWCLPSACPYHFAARTPCSFAIPLGIFLHNILWWQRVDNK